MTIGTRLFTLLNGEQMGTDTQGNVYYRSKRTPKGAREKRWVVYDGKVEASGCRRPGIPGCITRPTIFRRTMWGGAGTGRRITCRT